MLGLSCTFTLFSVAFILFTPGLCNFTCICRLKTYFVLHIRFYSALSANLAFFTYFLPTLCAFFVWFLFLLVNFIACDILLPPFDMAKKWQSCAITMLERQQQRSKVLYFGKRWRQLLLLFIVAFLHCLFRSFLPLQSNVKTKNSSLAWEMCK